MTSTLHRHFELSFKHYFCSKESDNDEEPVLYTRDAWPLSPNILSQTSSPTTKVNNSPAVSASDSGLFLASPDGHTTSSSSISDYEQVCLNGITFYDPAEHAKIHSSDSSWTMPWYCCLKVNYYSVMVKYLLLAKKNCFVFVKYCVCKLWRLINWLPVIVILKH